MVLQVEEEKKNAGPLPFNPVTKNNDFILVWLGDKKFPKFFFWLYKMIIISKHESTLNKRQQEGTLRFSSLNWILHQTKKKQKTKNTSVN